MILYQGQPATTSAVLFTADRRVTSYTILAVNLTASAARFRVNHCVKGAAAADTNVVVPDLSVPGNQMVAIDLPLELHSGDILRGSQITAAAITITIDGTDGT